jgi:ribosomal protein S21
VQNRGGKAIRRADTRIGVGVDELAEVRLQDGESIESALRRFKRKVQTEDIIKEVTRHSYYLKPGAKRCCPSSGFRSSGRGFLLG